jgi:hypothetical protein
LGLRPTSRGDKGGDCRVEVVAGRRGVDRHVRDDRWARIFDQERDGLLYLVATLVCAPPGDVFKEDSLIRRWARRSRTHEFGNRSKSAGIGEKVAANWTKANKVRQREIVATIPYFTWALCVSASRCDAPGFEGSVDRDQLTDDALACLVLGVNNHGVLSVNNG